MSLIHKYLSCLILSVLFTGVDTLSISRESDVLVAFFHKEMANPRKPIVNPKHKQRTRIERTNGLRRQLRRVQALRGINKHYRSRRKHARIPSRGSAAAYVLVILGALATIAIAGFIYNSFK